MTDEKHVAGLKIIIEGHVADISTNFEDCEATTLLFVSLLTVLKKDLHATKHFAQALEIVNKGEAQAIEINNPKEKKETLVN